MSLYLNPWIQVANSVSFKVVLVFVTKNSSDDDDDDGDNADRSQNRGDDPEIVGRALHHSCLTRGYERTYNIHAISPTSTSMSLDTSLSKTYVHWK